MSSSEQLKAVPWPQADRLAALFGREGSRVRAALLGGRRQGKSHLLRQIASSLFERGEGPIPVAYSFDLACSPAGFARHFAACFCQQVRAFLMRQPETLAEPVINLDKELERPGLPLSLVEMGRDFLSADASSHLELAAAFPQLFLHREQRPVCLLLDNCESAGTEGPFLPALDKLSSPWLITGRRAFVARAAGRFGWPAVALENLSPQDALILADQKCRELGLRFSREPWEDWLHYGGASPGWIAALAEAAALSGADLASTSSMARLYAAELTRGSIGNWLVHRWSAAAVAPPHSVKLAEILVSMAQDGASEIDKALPVSQESLAGLVEQEWLQETGNGLDARLGRVERDWLQLATPWSTAGQLDRARAKAEQTFACFALERRGSADFETVCELFGRRALQAAATPLSDALVKLKGEPGQLPVICSVAAESGPNAQLYWCYTVRRGPRAQSPQPSVLLLALCRGEPSTTEIKEWNQRLRKEAAALQPASNDPRHHGMKGAGASGELWLVLPPQVSLVPLGGEHRLRWAQLAELWVENFGTDSPVGESSGRGAQKNEAQGGTSELQARRAWLEQELHAVHEQLGLPAPPIETANDAASPQVTHDAITAHQLWQGPGDWRSTITLGLLMMSSELLAMQQQAGPSQISALREIQSQSQKILELLRAFEGAAPRPTSPPARRPSS